MQKILKMMLKMNKEFPKERLRVKFSYNLPVCKGKNHTEYQSFNKQFPMETVRYYKNLKNQIREEEILFQNK